MQKKLKSKLSKYELRLRELRRDQLMDAVKNLVKEYGTYSEGFDDGWNKGLEVAAEYISAFDKYVNHDYLLSECLLSKFGAMQRKPRKNKRKHVIVGIWNNEKVK